MAKREGIFCISTVLFLPLDTGLNSERCPWLVSPKKVLIMLKSSLDTNITDKKKNRAGSIKDCLDSYSVHAVWTDGRVENEKAFLSAFKQRMKESFKQEWSTKISESERFSTYFSFNRVHRLETHLNDITINKFRDTLIRLRLGINDLGVHKRFLRESFVNKKQTKKLSLLSRHFKRWISFPILLSSLWSCPAKLSVSFYCRWLCTFS